MPSRRLDGQGPASARPCARSGRRPDCRPRESRGVQRPRGGAPTAPVPPAKPRRPWRRGPRHLGPDSRRPRRLSPRLARMRPRPLRRNHRRRRAPQGRSRPGKRCAGGGPVAAPRARLGAPARRRPAYAWPRSRRRAPRKDPMAGPIKPTTPPGPQGWRRDETQTARTHGGPRRGRRPRGRARSRHRSTHGKTRAERAPRPPA